MTPTLEINLKVTKGILGLDILIIILLGLSGYFTMSILYGLIFGSVFSILNFRLLCLTLEKALIMCPDKSKKYVSGRFFIRMFLTGLVIVISLKSDYINIAGTITGLMLPSVFIKTSILLSNIKNKILKRKEA